MDLFSSGPPPPAGSLLLLYPAAGAETDRGQECKVRLERDGGGQTVQKREGWRDLQEFWKVWTCMSSRGKDCLKLYVTEVFFFWKIFVTWGRKRRRDERRREGVPGWGGKEDP